MQHQITEATREALAAALQAEADSDVVRYQQPYAHRAGMLAALDIVKSTPVNLIVPDYSGAVIFPHGCRVLGSTVDDTQPEYSRRMRDVTVERPFPYGDRVTVRAAVDFAPQLAASLAGHPEPHPEQGPAMPAAALCGDDSPGYPCVRPAAHHGHHRDHFGNRAPLRYLDRAGDVWESDDETGGWLGLVVAGGRRVHVGPGGGRLRTDVEVTFGPLARVETRRVVEVAEPVTAPAEPALCGDVDGARTCMSRPHHGHHIDGTGREWRQWYRDGKYGDLWVSVDETGDRVRLVVVDRQHLGFVGADDARLDAEQEHDGLTRVPTAQVPEQFRLGPPVKGQFPLPPHYRGRVLFGDHAPADPARVTRHVDAMASQPAPADNEPVWTGSSVRGVMRCQFGGVSWRLTNHPNAETVEGNPAGGWYLTAPLVGFLAGVWTGTDDLSVAVDVADSLIRNQAAKPAPAAASLPGTVYVVQSLIGDKHPAEGVYLSDAAADAAAHVVAGEGATTAPPVGNFTPVRGRHGGIRVSILALPLHTDDTPHGLPVVDQAAVTAALDAVDPGDPAGDDEPYDGPDNSEELTASDYYQADQDAEFAYDHGDPTGGA